MGRGMGTRYASGLSHLRNSMTGVFLGPLLAIAGIYLLFCKNTANPALPAVSCE